MNKMNTTNEFQINNSIDEKIIHFGKETDLNISINSNLMGSKLLVEKNFVKNGKIIYYI